MRSKKIYSMRTGHEKISLPPYEGHFYFPAAPPAFTCYTISLTKREVIDIFFFGSKQRHVLTNETLGKSSHFLY